MSEALEVRKYQERLDGLLESVPAYPEDRFEGRGVVVCAGGQRYFPCAWVCIKMLRRLGSSLPVELWYRGPREMNQEMIDLISPLGVRCVNAYEVAKERPVRRLDGWELKPFAVVNSSFREVLYLDADNVAARNPDFLFDTPQYLQTGTLFWPDRYMGHGDFPWLKRAAWEVCKVPYRVEPEFESGQFVIDKRRCWLPLQVALYLNEQSDFYYQYFYGDKDTYHLAWRRVGQEFSQIPFRPLNSGGSRVITQFDFEHRVLFQHRNGDKWRLDGGNTRVEDFANEEVCFGFLEELRAGWSGEVRRVPDDFTAPERRAYADIVSTRFFRYALKGHGERVLELLPDFRIARGAALMEKGWMLEEDKDGEAVLSILNDNGPTCFLRRDIDQTWRGRWLSYDRMPVELSLFRPA